MARLLHAELGLSVPGRGRGAEPSSAYEIDGDAHSWVSTKFLWDRGRENGCVLKERRMMVAGLPMFETRGDAAFLRNAGLFFWVIPRVAP
jgi:hypothetical protein